MSPMWNNKLNALALHIPKNAGTSIGMALGTVDGFQGLIGKIGFDTIHATLDEIVRDHNITPKHVFVCLRDPYTRFVSIFLACVQLGFLADYDTTLDGCLQFIDDIQQGRIGSNEVIRFLKPQCEYISDIEGCSIHFGFVDTIYDDLNAWTSKIGKVVLQVPFANVQEHIDCHLWSENTTVRTFVESYYANDFMLLSQIQGMC